MADSVNTGLSDSLNSLLDRVRAHPEIFRKPYASRLQLETLSQLGLRRSEQAAARGYVLLRPSGGSHSNPTPGLWVERTRLPEVVALLTEIEIGIQARADEKVSKARSRLVRSVSELTKLPGTDVEAALSADRLQRLLRAFEVHKDAAYALVSALGFRWQSRLVEPDGFWAPALHQFFPLPGRRQYLLYRQMMAGDPAGLQDYLDQEADRESRRRGELFVQWDETRPAWFPQSELREWVLKEGGKPLPTHPALFWSAHRNELWNRVPGAPGRHAVATDFLDVGGELWSADLPAECTLESARELIRQRMQTHMLSLRAELSSKFRSDLGKVLHWATSDELEAHLDSIWAETCRKNVLTADYLWSSADQRVRGLILRQKELWAQRQCQASLPSKLKDFYPLARQMGRRVTLFAGPTNSGKTYKALQLLCQANTGVYLAPLRLLALEVQETMTERGVRTSLVTGELLIPVEGARHSAATVEMLDLQAPVDVAVVDETQMLSDPDRGQAWLQAVLGAPAKHLVLVGSLAVVELVTQLMQYTGEPLEVVRTERLSPLEVLPHRKPLNTLTPGSAVVAFSRRDVLDLAGELRRIGRTVAVVYGALSPEVRREQARQFREGEADILVATDAIGMGLNLPVHTLVFSTLTKWDGQQERTLSHEEVRQIAGRAGRYGHSESGRVSTLNKADLARVESALAAPVRQLPLTLRAGFGEVFSDVILEHAGLTSLDEQLKFFVEHIRLDPWVSLVVSEDQPRLARFLDGTSLSLSEKLRLLNAPATVKGDLLPEFVQMVRTLEVAAVESFSWVDRVSGNETLEVLEDRSRALTLYGWMHYRYPRTFPRQALALETLGKVAGYINLLLRKTTERKCRGCGSSLRLGHRFAICDRCHQSRNGFYGDW